MSNEEIVLLTEAIAKVRTCFVVSQSIDWEQIKEALVKSNVSIEHMELTDCIYSLVWESIMLGMCLGKTIGE